MIACISRVFAVLVLGAAVLATTGCQKEEGPAEKAGKEIDKAMTEAGKQMQAAESKLREAFK
ncbi:hypothetical protein GSY71_14165 [Pusillimonas sp. TS35]|uniref:hypothetical protein n=1 Tax=Paracandidimonas lactea TaxID=2895524 RepID=UPI001369F301|nr:hypothetical protein [Paracandidimonas lactea]MYN14284.1 hypothetical protein [Pusillimonas sp. TS35]